MTFEANARDIERRLGGGGSNFARTHFSYDALAASIAQPNEWTQPNGQRRPTLACRKTTGPNGADRVSKSVYDATCKSPNIRSPLIRRLRRQNDAGGH